MRARIAWSNTPCMLHSPPHPRELAEGLPLALIDEFFDSWACWREACEDVRSAYLHWGKCAALQRGLAYPSYHAALNREEHTARLHGVWATRLAAAER